VVLMVNRESATIRRNNITSLLKDYRCRVGSTVLYRQHPNENSVQYLNTLGLMHASISQTIRIKQTGDALFDSIARACGHERQDSI
jgi:hypothetical protein